MYKVELSKAAQKSFKHLPTFVQEGFIKKFQTLVQNPYGSSGVDTIKAHESIGLPEGIAYRIRVGDYRAIYTIYDDELLIYVFEIEHRNKIYRKQ